MAIDQDQSQFGPIKENELILQRLKEALRIGKPLRGADVSFYIHEATESTKMIVNGNSKLT